MAENLTAQDGRQGKKGKPALLVLITSVVLALAAMVALLTWNGSNAPNEAAPQGKAGAQSTDTGPSRNAANPTQTNPVSPAPATGNATP